MEKKRILLSVPHLGTEEIKYVQDAFQTNWIAPVGENLRGFEQAVQQYTGANAALAVSSGTAAIHLALMLAGVQTGDEVLCSTFTFVATVNPVLYQNALPVLIDSEGDTWNICPVQLEKAIRDRIQKGKKPKAILVVHLYGQMAKMQELLEVAEKYAIPVIEDAAEALGATYQRKKAGTLGTLGIYSFNGNKVITTSTGGMLVANDREFIEKARFLATQAKENAPHYQHSEMGFNYRMSNILAGIGIGQMQVLEERIQQRRANFEYYQQQLQGIEGIEFLPEHPDTFSNRWLTCILLPSFSHRERLRKALERAYIESRPLWKPMHLQPLFTSCPYYGEKIAEDLFERGLCLPSSSNLSVAELERVIAAIRKQV